MFEVVRCMWVSEGNARPVVARAPTELLSSFQNVHFDELFFVNYSLFNLGLCTYVSECLCPSIIGLSWPLHFCA